jgi:uncharacterized protein with von Willebrand factor type A (vWA) domain
MSSESARQAAMHEEQQGEADQEQLVVDLEQAIGDRDQAIADRSQAQLDEDQTRTDQAALDRLEGSSAQILQRRQDRIDRSPSRPSISRRTALTGRSPAGTSGGARSMTSSRS